MPSYLFIYNETATLNLTSNGQVLPESREHEFDFDILDATKIWPEELVPIEYIGEMTLDRCVDEFFAETEQVAFCTSHIVPGIGFSDDPLLQGRNFSYLDTQQSRLGTNWEQVCSRPPLFRCPHYLYGFAFQDYENDVVSFFCSFR
jgi:catalase